MTTPSAKEAFSVKGIDEILLSLNATGNNFFCAPIQGENGLHLTIYGDLITDITGFDGNIDVVGGNIKSNISISGRLSTRPIEKGGYSPAAIQLNDTSVRADAITLCGERDGIYGHGQVDVERYITAPIIATRNSQIRTKTLKTNYIDGENLNIMARQTIECDNKITGAALITNKLFCKELGQGSEVFALEFMSTSITDGAKVFADRVMTSKLGFNKDGLQGPKIFAESLIGTLSGSFVDVMDAEILTLMPNPELDLRRHVVVGCDDMTRVISKFEEASPEMQDFVRLGYDKMDRSMPERICSAVHKMHVSKFLPR